eukprot:Gregarina_sp_Poly_1__3312@NODE_1952_length_3009_cov_10_353161_g1257_i0_p1_GENE_NODE_1952_length_3009_cov_10_353161_g1257_i0NODE_1952_length_3009_cov_10_353161_g1257_i0_p1_ORF_typecomplete_len387_score33_29_NODE_1952_length_3009_cov_10_353161_g1257_i014922652
MSYSPEPISPPRPMNYNDTTTNPISGSYFLRMRKSIYKQSRMFVTRPSDDCRAILALPNVTDPMSKTTEDPYPGTYQENIDFNQPAAETQRMGGAAEAASPTVISEERFKAPVRTYWSHPLPVIFLGIVDCLGPGMMETFPYMMTHGAGITLIIAILLSYIYLIIPVMQFEIISGQIYQGTATRAMPLQHLRLTGIAVAFMLIAIAQAPDSFNQLGISTLYFANSFKNPLPWGLHDSAYEECSNITDLVHCEETFKCFVFNELCLANPLKYAEHFYNVTVVGEPATTYPPPPRSENPGVRVLYWPIVMGSTVAFALFWFLVDMGGKKMFEFGGNRFEQTSKILFSLYWRHCTHGVSVDSHGTPYTEYEGSNRSSPKCFEYETRSCF